jgi:hypothetical protein
VLKEIEKSLSEEFLVVFNLLKKILDNSHSSLPIVAIAAQDMGIQRNFILLRHCDKLFPLVNPKIQIKNNNTGIQLISDDKMVYSFSQAESKQILNYLIVTGYIQNFKRI